MNSNTLVLHSISKTSGVFIHWNPALVSYALRWTMVLSTSTSLPAFHHNGGFFAQNSMARHEEKKFTDPVLLYLAWFVPYGVWLLTTGVNASGCRSSFLDVQQKMQGIFKLHPSELRSQGFGYLLVHMTLNLAACFASSFLCFHLR